MHVAKNPNKSVNSNLIINWEETQGGDTSMLMYGHRVAPEAVRTVPLCGNQYLFVGITIHLLISSSVPSHTAISATR